MKKLFLFLALLGILLSGSLSTLLAQTEQDAAPKPGNLYLPLIRGAQTVAATVESATVGAASTCRSMPIRR